MSLMDWNYLPSARKLPFIILELLLELFCNFPATKKEITIIITTIIIAEFS